RSSKSTPRTMRLRSSRGSWTTSAACAAWSSRTARRRAPRTPLRSHFASRSIPVPRVCHAATRRRAGVVLFPFEGERAMHIAAVCSRFRLSFADPAMRTKVLALAGGKAIGLILLLTAMGVFRGQAVFADAGGPTPEVNAINTAWTLIAAFLVFGMQVGFVMLEAGFARSRESINILVEGIVDTCICGVTFWLWGFAFMFEPGNGFIGTTGFMLKGLADT